MVQAGLEAEATEFYARARTRTRTPSSHAVGKASPDSMTAHPDPSRNIGMDGGGHCVSSLEEGLSCEIGSRGVEAAIGFKELIPFLSAKYSLSRLQGQEDEYAETCKHRENILDPQLFGDCVSKVCTLRIESDPC